MIGAIIGDTVGSRFEWSNIKTKDFVFLTKKCRPTDDSIMTLAIAKAIVNCRENFKHLDAEAVKMMQSFGRKYPHAGYGGSFRRWLVSPEPMPYNSWGNGAAMRVSACGWVGNSIDETIQISKSVTAVTHNHPEGIKGAEAVSVAIFLLRAGVDKEKVKEYVEKHYYPLDFTLDEIRPAYSFDVSCMGSVPQAFEAFFESDSFVDAIRNAISIGGDSDTIAAITGGIAEAYYGVPNDLREDIALFLDDFQLDVISEFETFYPPKSDFGLKTGLEG